MLKPHPQKPNTPRYSHGSVALPEGTLEKLRALHAHLNMRMGVIAGALIDAEYAIHFPPTKSAK